MLREPTIMDLMKLLCQMPMEMPLSNLVLNSKYKMLLTAVNESITKALEVKDESTSMDQPEHDSSVLDV